MAANRVKTGDQFSIAAKDWNGMLKMLREFQRNSAPTMSARTGRGEPVHTANVLHVRNDSGANVGQFNILGIDDQVFTLPTDLNEFKRHAVLSGITPSIADHATKFVITAEPIIAGQLGKAYIDGVCIVQIEVADEALTYATVTDADATKLTAAASGPVEILWKDAGTGLLWAIVRLSASQSADRFNAKITGASGAAHDWEEVERFENGWQTKEGGRNSTDLGQAYEYNGRQSTPALVVIMEAVRDETGKQYRFDITYGGFGNPAMLDDGVGLTPNAIDWDVNDQGAGEVGAQSPGPVYRVFMGDPAAGDAPAFFRRQQEIDGNGNMHAVAIESQDFTGELTDVITGLSQDGDTVTATVKKVAILSSAAEGDQSFSFATGDEKVALSDSCEAGYLNDVLQFAGAVSESTVGCVKTVTIAGDANTVLVSANDTTPGFLGAKIVSGDAWMELTETNDGANETLVLTHGDPGTADNSITAVTALTVADVGGVQKLRVTTAVTSYDEKGHKTGSTTVDEDFPLVEVTALTGWQISGTDIQVKTTKGYWLKADTESGWTTVHNGTECAT